MDNESYEIPQDIIDMINGGESLMDTEDGICQLISTLKKKGCTVEQAHWIMEVAAPGRGGALVDKWYAFL